MKLESINLKLSLMHINLDALERSWEKNTLPILWKWVQVNLKY